MPSETAQKPSKKKPAAEAATEKPPVPAFYDPKDIPIGETAELEIKLIKLNGGTQPRVALDESHIDDMKETIKQSIKDGMPNPFDFLPDENLPVIFRDPTGKCVLADGFHRLAAHKGAGLKEIKVSIRNGTVRDALLYSTGTNSQHGLKRNNKDKNRAARILTSDPEFSQWSDSDLAKIANVSTTVIKNNRVAAKSPTVRKFTTKTGKTATINTANLGKGKKAKPEKAEPRKSSEDEAKELDKALMHIAEKVGGDEGGKIRRGVLDAKKEYEHLTKKDIHEWASFAPAKIKAVTPLIQEGWKPAKAFDYLGEELSEKCAEELRLRCLGGGGEYITEIGKFAVVVTTKK